jgi:anti-sigma factor RsiW
VTCREFLEFISTYLDGELPAPELVEFERHLAICPACVRYLASYSKTPRPT